MESILTKEMQAEKPANRRRTFLNYPRNYDYSQTMIYKLCLDYGGLEKSEEWGYMLHQGVLTVEYALDYIRHVDNLSRHVQKIIVLAGFQEGGHDWQYPAMGPLNSKIRSREHPEWDGDTCIRYIMEECRNYHTRATVHTNVVDAYEINLEKYPDYDNSLFYYYREHGLLARNAAGEYYKGWKAPQGQAYLINHKKAFEDTNGTRRRIDELFALLPAIVETGVLYTDANNRIPPSEWDGISRQEQADAYNDLQSWVKSKYNVDMIGEVGLTQQYGYFAHGMTWDHAYDMGEASMVSGYPMQVPAYIMAAGNAADVSNAQMRIFGEGVQLEHEVYHDLENMKAEIIENTVPYFFLNTKLREAYVSGENFARFSENVKSMLYTGSKEGLKNYDPASGKGTFEWAKLENDRTDIVNSWVITQENALLKSVGANGTDLFIPVVWREKELLAYSSKGGKKVWKFPKGWEAVESVDIYSITPEGLEAEQTGVNVKDGTLTLDMEIRGAKTVVPAGTNIDENYRKGSGVSAEYLGIDMDTQGSWTEHYGKSGYSIVGGEECLPAGVVMSHNGTREIIWKEGTKEQRALCKSRETKERISAVKTSELHQLIDVDTNGEKRQVSLYLLDWETEGSRTLVEVIDPVTMECLTARLVEDYRNGIYVKFNLTGHGHIRLTRIFNEKLDTSWRGPVYVAGVFFD